MITESCFVDNSKALNIELACIKAVAEVESRGNGFIDNEPIILFEPHVFWKQLKAVGIDPQTKVKGNEDILYPKWGSKPYGPTSRQHERLNRAVQIHRNAALSSASWGKFQIMGFNWKTCGYESLQDFITAMYNSEDDHLKAFCHFIKSSNLDDALRNKEWEVFARGYNGDGFKQNNYDRKLQDAYKRISATLQQPLANETSNVDASS